MRTKVLIRRYAIAIGAAAVLIALDIVTKRNAALSFRATDLTVIPGVLWFTFVENSGSAFSLFRAGGQVFGVAAIVAFIFVLGTLRKPQRDIETVAYGLIMGGALGNFVDRVFRGDGIFDGTVIDWIRVPDFPVFNLADSALTVGVGLLFLAMWQQRDKPA